MVLPGDKDLKAESVPFSCCLVGSTLWGNCSSLCTVGSGLPYLTTGCSGLKRDPAALWATSCWREAVSQRDVLQYHQNLWVHTTLEPKPLLSHVLLDWRRWSAYFTRLFLKTLSKRTGSIPQISHPSCLVLAWKIPAVIMVCWENGQMLGSLSQWSWWHVKKDHVCG